MEIVIKYGRKIVLEPVDTPIHFMPNDLSTMLPTLRCNPCFVVGIPVLRATFCLTLVMPTARFHEKDNPGIFIS